MTKEIEELMQKTIIGEDKNLSNLIEDIEPIKENRFTDLEMYSTTKTEFSLVVYKNENIFIRFFKGIKLTFEKFKIMKNSREFVLEKNTDK